MAHETRPLSRATTFAASALGQSAQPILYLNACTVGRSAAVLGHPGGFAGNCIESGWSGVVAPYWPVYDASAAEFAVAFYKKLQAGRSLGEALQELRAERPLDPTAQSYAYYGDPYARVLFNDSIPAAVLTTPSDQQRDAPTRNRTKRSSANATT